MSASVVVAAIAAGALGALVRYGVALLLGRRAVPWAVLAVNIAGSAVAGAVLGVVERAGLAADTATTLSTIVVGGFCGGLTTFSTFGVETVQLMRRGRARLALTSIAANLVLGIGACLVAYLLVAAVLATSPG